MNKTTEALNLAIEWIEKWHGYSPSKDKALRACYQALKNIEKKSEIWVSVDEKLPELNTEVMTFGSGTANNSFGYMQAWYSENGWQELDSCGDFFNDIPPTHWIPLSAYGYPEEE